MKFKKSLPIVEEFPRQPRPVRRLLPNAAIGFTFQKKPDYRRTRSTYPFGRSATQTTPGPSIGNDLKLKLDLDDESPEVFKRLGVTIWRLETKSTRKADDETAKILVQQEGDKGLEYTPERVSVDTVFKLGDKVRLSFESPTAGYLYIFNSEILEGDKIGEPYQMFPTRSTRGGDNRVLANSVVDIPALSDHIPYFTFQKTGAKNYGGVLLTVIVSPEPLSDFSLPDRPVAVSQDLVVGIENKYLKVTEEYEQIATVGKTYTRAEEAAGIKSTVQLTRNDPFPQTYYRVIARPEEALLVNIRLSVK
ncbi:MAG: hypothetical protein ACKVRN_14370 [Pyrinomonadaceae bacterium]